MYAIADHHQFYSTIYHFASTQNNSVEKKPNTIQTFKQMPLLGLKLRNIQTPELMNTSKSK